MPEPKSNPWRGDFSTAYFVVFDRDGTLLAASSELGKFVNSLGAPSIKSLRACLETAGNDVRVQELDSPMGLPITIMVVRALKRSLGTSTAGDDRQGLQSLVGESPAMHELRENIFRAARANFPVLITGETGVGKELCARGIHDMSARSQGPFVAVNCSAIPVNLAEAVLFGYAPGAFTDAMKSGYAGKFEQAHRGTLFLDEISEMPLSLQAKVLRVIQGSEVERLGGSYPIKVDVRLVAATNRDLSALVGSNDFRADLFYRLNVIGIQVPALRERREDIPQLVDYYLNETCQELNIPRKLLAPNIAKALYEYHWPGNVRELINAIKRLIISVDDSQPFVERLPAEVAATFSNAVVRSEANNGALSVSEERTQLVRVLEQSRGNRSEAARRLGVHRSTLYAMLRRHGIAAK